MYIHICICIYMYIFVYMRVRGFGVGADLRGMSETLAQRSSSSHSAKKPGLGFRVSGFGFRGFGFRGLLFMVQGLGCRL